MVLRYPKYLPSSPEKQNPYTQNMQVLNPRDRADLKIYPFREE